MLVSDTFLHVGNLRKLCEPGIDGLRGAAAISPSHKATKEGPLCDVFYDNGPRLFHSSNLSSAPCFWTGDFC